VEEMAVKLKRGAFEHAKQHGMLDQLRVHH
jgi:hypothetical protein